MTSEKLKFKNISIETVVSLCNDITNKFLPVRPQLRLLVNGQLHFTGVNSLNKHSKIDELTIMFNKSDRSLQIILNFNKNECSVNCVHPDQEKIVSYVQEQLKMNQGKQVQGPAKVEQSEPKVKLNLSEKTKAELMELATTRGIKVNTKMIKRDIIKALDS